MRLYGSRAIRPAPSGRFSSDNPYRDICRRMSEFPERDAAGNLTHTAAGVLGDVRRASGDFAAVGRRFGRAAGDGGFDRISLCNSPVGCLCGTDHGPAQRTALKVLTQLHVPSTGHLPTLTPAARQPPAAEARLQRDLLAAMVGWSGKLTEITGGGQGQHGGTIGASSGAAG